MQTRQSSLPLLPLGGYDTIDVEAQLLNVIIAQPIF